jgi:putative transposase
MTPHIFPQRKSPRLKGYDYSQQGMYFVTVVTHHRQLIFGQIDNQIMTHYAIGQLVLDRWLALPNHHNGVEIDLAVIMPNHIHGIIALIRDMPMRVDNPTGQPDAVSLPNYPNSNKIVNLSGVMGAYKASVTRLAREKSLHPTDSPVWQSRYHDRIIRSEAELNHYRHYIENNPLNWQIDTLK